MLLAPNKIATIRRVMRAHPEINTRDEDARAEILDIAAAEDNAKDARRPWGRKSRNPQGTDLNTDGYTFYRPDGLFEIYDVISGVDGSATWEGYGPFRQGENGFWVPARPVAGTPAPQPAPPPVPAPAPDALAAILTRLDALESIIPTSRDALQRIGQRLNELEHDALRAASHGETLRQRIAALEQKPVPTYLVVGGTSRKLGHSHDINVTLEPIS